jgi:hypothetical protein
MPDPRAGRPLLPRSFWLLRVSAAAEQARLLCRRIVIRH